jgi:hypothetical protein
VVELALNFLPVQISGTFLQLTTLTERGGGPIGEFEGRRNRSTGGMVSLIESPCLGSADGSNNASRAIEKGKF